MFAHEIVGESFIQQGMDHPVIVRGVLEDFHYSNLVSAIGPLVIRNQPDELRYANIRLASNDQDNTLAFLEDKWREMDTGHAFEPKYMDHQLEESPFVLMETVHRELGPDPAENYHKGGQSQNQAQEIDQGGPAVLNHDPQDHFNMGKSHIRCF